CRKSYLVREKKSAAYAPSTVANRIFQAISTMMLTWLNAVHIWGVGLAVIAAIYVGLAVADGRKAVIAVEIVVVFAFVICATLAIAALIAALVLTRFVTSSPGVTERSAL